MFQFIYKIMINILGTGMTIPNWDFMGSTMVTNNYIRITPDLQSKQGALWNSVVSTLFIFVHVLDIYKFNMKTIYNISTN